MKKQKRGSVMVEDNTIVIDVEVSEGVETELVLRAESMGLTVSEYVGCIMGQHLSAG